jgi:HEAT repeat protein
MARLSILTDVSQLREVYISEADKSARAQLGHALAVRDDRDGMWALKADLLSNCSGSRRMAAESASLIKPSAELPELLRLLDDENDDVRVRAAHALLFRSGRHKNNGR